MREKFDSLLATTAAAESARLARPQKVEDFQDTLPADFKVPQDFGEYKFDDKSPALAEFKKVALEAGLTQESYSKALSAFAATQIAASQAVKTAHAAEIAKLGATGPQRVDAIGTWARGALGDKHAGIILNSLFTSAQVEAWEAVLQRFQSQGSASFSQSHREHDAGGRMTEEQYAKMSFNERLDYARARAAGKAA